MSRKQTKNELTSHQRKSVAALLGTRDFRGELAIAQQRITELEAELTLADSREGTLWEELSAKHKRIASLENLLESLLPAMRNFRLHFYADKIEKVLKVEHNRAADAVGGLDENVKTPNAMNDQFPNLSALANGGVSGRIAEWPLLKHEAKQVFRRVEELANALKRIADWTDAYPSEAFPNQDLKKADSVLVEHGISMSAMHGQWARHLISGIGEIARNALTNGAD